MILLFVPGDHAMPPALAQCSTFTHHLPGPGPAKLARPALRPNLVERYAAVHHFSEGVLTLASMTTAHVLVL